MTPKEREQHKLYMRAYRVSHPEQREKARQRARAYSANNRDKVNAYRAKPEVRARNRAKARDRNATRPETLYRTNLARCNLTPEQYEHLLTTQGGGCFFCGTSSQPIRSIRPLRRLLVDHNHETGRVRGILCVGCNISLGYAERGFHSRLDPKRITTYLGNPPLVEAW